MRLFAVIYMLSLFAYAPHPQPVNYADPPPLSLASLQVVLTEGGIADYYAAHHASIREAFAEYNETRLRALWGMYIVSIAVPYGVVDKYPTTLQEFADSPTAHCGTYALAQGWVYDALGLQWRIISVDNGWHGLVEVNIGGRYETLDATTNTAFSVSVRELLTGKPRTFTLYYEPITDPNAPDVYRAHIVQGWNVLGLRYSEPEWGITVFPNKWEVVSESA